MRYALAICTLLITCVAQAQWKLQESHTTADLRGIHSIGSGVAWVSGTNGTVLRTLDDGATWQSCATPPNAEHLDFRGIQAFDAQTAIIMSSGKGDLSRLYKTTDGCQTWKLVFTNPDKEGFWDAVQFSSEQASSKQDFGVLLGDPVAGHFPLFLSYDRGERWELQIQPSPIAETEGEAVFAASNSSLVVHGLHQRGFVTGGKGGPRLISFWVGKDDTGTPDPIQVSPGAKAIHYYAKKWSKSSLPVTGTAESSGAFSIAKYDWREVIVGGDYSHPESRQDTCWYIDGSHPTDSTNWQPGSTPPHGYRSAVAYFPARKAWITVGPNGTDLSTDDGRIWRPLKPIASDAIQDEDQHWNALSLPFVVGPHGRIGKLREDALPH